MAGVGDVSGSEGESVRLLRVEASSGESTADPSGRGCFGDQEHTFGRDMYADGSPRMHRGLLNRGCLVCENTVARLMNSEGIVSSTTKNFQVNATNPNHSLPIADNIPERNITTDGPGYKLFFDLTYISTAEGFLYLVCMVDVYSHRLVDAPRYHNGSFSVWAGDHTCSPGQEGHLNRK